MEDRRHNPGPNDPALSEGDEVLLRAVVDEAAATVRDDRTRFRLALVYPVVIGLLAMLGTLWTTATNDRLISNLEGSFQEPPITAAAGEWPRCTPGQGLLMAGGIAVAVALAAWIARLGRSVGGHAGQAARCDVLAQLAGSDLVPADRDRIATELMQGIEPPLHTAGGPLVALVESEPDIDRRAATLRATAAFYRGLDDRQRRRARRLVPVVGCLIAGLAVLLYGVALFRPMTRLFGSLAEVHEPIGRGGGR
jgi:hypothetical protein